MDEFGPDEIAGQMPDTNIAAELKEIVKNNINASAGYGEGDMIESDYGERATRDYPGSAGYAVYSAEIEAQLKFEALRPLSDKGIPMEDIVAVMKTLTDIEVPKSSHDEDEIFIEQIISITPDVEMQEFDIEAKGTASTGGMIPTKSQGAQRKIDRRRGPDY